MDYIFEHSPSLAHKHQSISFAERIWELNDIIFVRPGLNQWRGGQMDSNDFNYGIHILHGLPLLATRHGNTLITSAHTKDHFRWCCFEKYGLEIQTRRARNTDNFSLENLLSTNHRTAFFFSFDELLIEPHDVIFPSMSLGAKKESLYPKPKKGKFIFCHKTRHGRTVDEMKCERIPI